jgi:hypothetical protein
LKDDISEISVVSEDCQFISRVLPGDELNFPIERLDLAPDDRVYLDSDVTEELDEFSNLEFKICEEPMHWMSILTFRLTIFGQYI